MGTNDAAEMLEAAKADNVKMERQRSAVLALVEPIIERTKDQIGTHSTNCHEYHVACLAVAVRHRLTEGGRG